MKTRARFLIKGIVQGVGFRPFIYNLARSHKLNGWVLNSTDGVYIEAEGEKEVLGDFTQQIQRKAPPLASIDSVDVEYLPLENYRDFVIKPSSGDKDKYIKISPDVCTCKDCLSELFDPKDRRYRYPFLNCTNCGPRFTIIQDIPYDRPKTTMRDFKMCPDCQAEYEDPVNRRFHAQPNACPVCGPSVKLFDLKGPVKCDEPIMKAVKLLKEGNVIAVKGLGGFHLACDPENDEAVKLMRERKHRTHKPFAIMAKDLDTVKSYCLVTEEEKELLQSYRRPIVLLEKLPQCNISSLVAPNNNYLGVMLPYTPLHYLLLDDQLSALVMTSGNISEEPLAVDNQEALDRLSGLADYFLLHNRDIYMRCDDSVAKVERNQAVMIRRSRGYAPYPVDLDFSMKQILACGPELKNTFCLTKDNHAFISHHIGDLQNEEAFSYYRNAVQHYKNMFRIHPEAIAYDLHPDYLSTKYALSHEDIKLIGIQHHHAHIASCMAENGIKEKVIGVSCDGTGYGSDGKIWGCEFMTADFADFQRHAHLKYIHLPGGDKAAKEPYRMALSYLYQAFGQDFDKIDTPLLHRLEDKKIDLIKQIIQKDINSPMTSSCGRLFDAVSSLIGIRDAITYEAQAAIELEMIASPDVSQSYIYNIENADDCFNINVSGMIREIIHDLNQNLSKGMISAKFHNTLANFITETCKFIGQNWNNESDKVVLSGGTFQNRYLTNKLYNQLKKQGFKVYTQKRVPTNDGGISLGQAVIANQQLS
ncbi:carbamoyltransferase HypF [Candidatus Poribacteria bacterium]|nr:carbamoyltransferase HypF [Candidatus Poribacteria bacterium]